MTLCQFRQGKVDLSGQRYLLPSLITYMWPQGWTGWKEITGSHRFSVPHVHAMAWESPSPPHTQVNVKKKKIKPLKTCLHLAFLFDRNFQCPLSRFWPILLWSVANYCTDGSRSWMTTSTPLLLPSTSPRLWEPLLYSQLFCDDF